MVSQFFLDYLYNQQFCSPIRNDHHSPNAQSRTITSQPIITNKIQCVLYIQLLQSIYILTAAVYIYIRYTWGCVVYTHYCSFSAIARQQQLGCQLGYGERIFTQSHSSLVLVLQRLAEDRQQLLLRSSAQQQVSQGTMENLYSFPLVPSIIEVG